MIYPLGSIRESYFYYSLSRCKPTNCEIANAFYFSLLQNNIICLLFFTLYLKIIWNIILIIILNILLDNQSINGTYFLYNKLRNTY